MKTVTVRFAEEYAETLDDEAEKAGLSRAEYLRELIDQGREAPAIRDELDETRTELQKMSDELDTIRDELDETKDELAAVEGERDAAQARADNLRDQLAATNRRVDQHQDLVRTVERQQSLAERKASAGVLTRAKWWLVGMGDEE